MYVSVTPENWMLEKIHGLKKRGVDGDYQTKEMATVMDTPESIAHLYESYEAFAWRKKGIVYAIDREHAKHIAAYYQSKGVRCAVIDAKTPAAVRAEIVERYKASSGIDVIVNVDIFSEGLDCPEVEFIQLARPTLSLSKYLQQVGRGMRKVPFKDYVTIVYTGVGAMGLAEEYEEARAEEVKDRLILDNKNRRTERLKT